MAEYSRCQGGFKNARTRGWGQLVPGPRRPKLKTWGRAVPTPAFAPSGIRRPSRRGPCNAAVELAGPIGYFARLMTLTEKLLARAAGKTTVQAGDNIWVNADVLMTHDVCGPGTIGVFKREFGRTRQSVGPARKSSSSPTITFSPPIPSPTATWTSCAISPRNRTCRISTT